MLGLTTEHYPESDAALAQDKCIEQRLESTSLDLQEGLESESTELTLNLQGGVLESTNT